MSEDLVKMDKECLLDLIEAVKIMTGIMHDNKSIVAALTDDEMQRIGYVNKLVLTAKENYVKHN